MNNSLAQLLTHKLEEYKSSYFDFNGERLSFEEINYFSNAYAQEILKKVGSEGVVIISSYNSFGFILSFLSALKAGATIFLLPSLKFYEVYEPYIRYFDKVLLFADKDNLAALSWQPKCEIIEISSPNFLKNLRAQKKSKIAFSWDDAKRTVLLLSTGGTTGIPKLVELTNDNLVSNLHQIADSIKNFPIGTKLLSCLPFFHAFGLLVGISFPIFFGRCAYIKREFNIKDFIQTIQMSQIDICFIVPQIARLLCKILSENKMELPLKLCVSGGDKLDASIFEVFRAHTGLSIVEGYGLTETSPVTHLNPQDNPKAGSIGKPLIHTECKIINGELLIRGPQVMKGYFRNEEETSAIFTPDGYLKTGDLATIDEEGFYYIVGRAKEIIKCAGKSIFPYEIEREILKIEGIAEAAVIGKKDKIHGEVPVAFVVKKEGVEISEGEVLKHLGNNLPPSYLPRQVIFKNSLPKTPLGKIQKFLLVKEIE
jgi:acyl-CoA synthetase (AMP-forming)/AMP-acid ligase II